MGDLDLFLDAADVEIDAADYRLDREQLKLLASIRRLIRREGDKTMANLDSINAALGDLSDQITQLAAQVADLNVGSITQDQLDDIAAKLETAAGQVDAIVEPDAGEATPPVA